MLQVRDFNESLIIYYYKLLHDYYYKKATATIHCTESKSRFVVAASAPNQSTNHQHSSLQTESHCSAACNRHIEIRHLVGAAATLVLIQYSIFPNHIRSVNVLLNK